MPQLFRVLRCYSCLVFQGHQVKKVSKFQCKVCGEKQSIKRFYGVGNGQECRKHVQKLNEKAGITHEASEESSLDSEDDTKYNCKPAKANTMLNNDSKWSAYTEDKEENVTSNVNVTKEYFGGKEVVFEIPKKKRKSSKNNKSNVLSPVKSNELIINEIENDNICHYVGKEKKQHQIVKENQKLETNDSQLIGKKSQTVENIKVNIKPKKFVPPTTSKQSKWAQYTEECSSHEEELVSNPQNLCEINNQTIVDESPKPKTNLYDLFSLCDDSDLDSILQL